MKEAGRFIADRRREIGLTQEAAAEKAGLSSPHWIRLEHGGSGTKPDTLEKIASALDLTPGTVPYQNLYKLAGLYPPDVEFVRTTTHREDPFRPTETHLYVKPTEDDWIDTPDEYDAFDLSDDPVIQALATGLDSDAIEAARSAMLENGRMTLAEFVKKRRAEGVVGARAQDE